MSKSSISSYDARLASLEKKIRSTQADIGKAGLLSSCIREDFSELREKVRDLQRCVCVLMDQVLEFRNCLKSGKNNDLDTPKPVAERRGNCRIIRFGKMA